jgi:hypothetical protein
VLTISAKHSEEKKSERDGYVRQEVVSGNFYRQIPVGQLDPSDQHRVQQPGLIRGSDGPALLDGFPERR